KKLRRGVFRPHAAHSTHLASLEGECLRRLLKAMPGTTTALAACKRRPVRTAVGTLGPRTMHYLVRIFPPSGSTTHRLCERRRPFRISALIKRILRCLRASPSLLSPPTNTWLRCPGCVLESCFPGLFPSRYAQSNTRSPLAS